MIPPALVSVHQIIIIFLLINFIRNIAVSTQVQNFSFLFHAYFSVDFVERLDTMFSICNMRYRQPAEE